MFNEDGVFHWLPAESVQLTFRTADAVRDLGLLAADIVRDNIPMLSNHTRAGEFRFYWWWVEAGALVLQIESPDLILKIAATEEDIAWLALRCNTTGIETMLKDQTDLTK